jgi:hypothetical protein
MFLSEDDVLLGAVERPPCADAPLQRAADAGANLGMTPPDLIKDGDRPQTGDALLSSGTTSLSQTADNGSRRRRSRGACFCDGNRGSASMR